jgi:hypothetical protein
MKLTICLLLLFLANLCFAQTVNFTSSNLPIVVINTLGNAVVDEPKINATMGIIFNGEGARNSITDSFNNYKGNIGIEYRGQSSQMFPLKSYGFELRNTANASQEKSLLGIAKESDWILYAPYNDKTLMRNVLAYTLSNRLGRWATQCRYVELVVNNEYRGIYVLMEKIKRGSNRVNVSKIGTSASSGDALTGGYIISIDKDPAAFTSNYLPPNAADKQIRFSNVYPKPENITAIQNDYIKSYVDSFETTLNGADFQNPQTGVRKFADLSSFIDYFLINELSHNVDGYRLSTYLYKDKNSLDGKLTIGPVWDYDLSFRNANYCNGSNTNTWAYQFNTTCPDDYWQIPFWWNKLMTDTAFKASLKCRYTAVRQNAFSTATINGIIDSIHTWLGEAQARHFTKWPVLGHYVWPNPDPIAGTYDEEISALKNWIAERNNWLDNNMPNEGACATIRAAGGLQIKITPNPIKQNGTIVLISDAAEKLTLVISNSTGQVKLAQYLLANAGTNILQNLPFNSWPNGLYFLRAFTASGKSTVAKVLLIK